MKPLDMEELVLWVKSLFRRVELDTAKQGGGIRAGDLELDTDSSVIRYKGRLVSGLTNRELEVLSCLVKHSPKVISREYIMEKVWRTVAVANLVDTHIHNLAANCRRMPRLRSSLFPAKVSAILRLTYKGYNMKRIITIAGIFVLACGIQAKFVWGEIGFGPGQSMAPAETIKEAGAIQVPADKTLGEIKCAAAQITDFRITKTDLGETGWNFIPLIENFQSQVPPHVERHFNNASRLSLRRGIPKAYEGEIQTGASPEREKVVIELTQILVETPYSVFRKIIPAEKWGTKIAHHLGGEVRIVERNPAGRAVRQLERMVLSGVPFADINLALTNQDMTKAEIIQYGQNGAKVYWRVYHSDNGSTKADLGSVEFSSYDENSVLVTFHSAHKIRGLELTPAAAKPILEKTFLDHARQYQTIADRAGL